LLGDALLADAVPINRGDPTDAADFDPECFLDRDRYARLDALAAAVVALDQDDEAYLERLSAPVFPAGESSPWVDPDRERAFAARVCDAAAAGRRWFWMGSRPDGEALDPPLELLVGPAGERDRPALHLSSDPLDQPDVCADEVDLEDLPPPGLARLSAPVACLQWEPAEALEAFTAWRGALAPGGRIEVAVPDWAHCRAAADEHPREAFAALFAHGSRRAPRWGWTAEDLERCLARAGFGAVEVRAFGAELRARAAAEARDLPGGTGSDRDLLVAWPRFEEEELAALFARFAELDRTQLRLVLRHDPRLDGGLPGAMATLQRAAQRVSAECGRALEEIDLVGQDERELCPFEIGSRTRAVLLDVARDPRKRRFLTALGAPLVRIDDALALLGGRRAG
ncbi:MAG: hypothetical protein AAFZ65_01395, partial [Planctomycetota bacterium]